MGWTKRKKFRYRHDNFIFEYDTARELGQLVRESKCGMPNPYEPNSEDYDDFNEYN